MYRDIVSLKGNAVYAGVFDPTYDQGHGERTFVNERGVADLFAPEHLPDSFFDSDIVAFEARRWCRRVTIV